MSTFAPGAVDHALRVLFPTPSPYLHDPAGWVQDRLGEHLWSRQRDVAQALVTHRRVAVPACHSAGKSFLAARLAAWWLDPDVHPAGSAFVVTTAPTDTQVKAILWREIGKARRRGKLPGRVTQDAQWKLRVGGDEELVAYGRKPQDLTNEEEAATAFQGIHARFVLVIVDEACGIPAWLWTGVDALLTNDDARVLAIGNPTDPTSKFAEHCAPTSQWHVERIDGLMTPNFTGEDVPEDLRPMLLSKTWVDEAREATGEDSAYFVSRVRGLFPTGDDDSTLIPPVLIAAAQERSLPAPEIAWGRVTVDVARYGKDHTVIAHLDEGRFRVLRSEPKSATTQVTGWTRSHWLDMGANPEVVVDEDGIGGAVLDELRARSGEQGTPPMDVRGFRAGVRAQRPDRFVNRRSEAWWTVREQMQDGLLDLDPDDTALARQLGSIRFSYRPDGRIQVESKEDMSKRGLPSPDRADTLMMAVVRTPRWVPEGDDIPVVHDRGSSPAAGAMGWDW